MSDEEFFEVCLTRKEINELHVAAMLGDPANIKERLRMARATRKEAVFPSKEEMQEVVRAHLEDIKVGGNTIQVLPTKEQIIDIFEWLANTTDAPMNITEEEDWTGWAEAYLEQRAEKG